MAQNTETPAERLNNFDSIRLLAALGVIVTHSFALLGLPERDFLYFATRGVLSCSRLGLYTFFALSGYLVCMSARRSTSIGSFFSKRALRIFPGLIVVLLLSALILGPFMTTLGLGEYFASASTWKYLLSVSLYRVYYLLPGVFADNSYPVAVNGSLWTLAYECTLYVILAAGVLLWQWGGTRGKGLARPGIVIAGFGGLILALLTQLDLHHFFTFAGFFGVGAALSYVRKEWFVDVKLIVAALGVLILGFWTPISAYILFLTLPYLLLALGYANLPRFRALSASGDYSYGFYIYAFPIQQALATTLPRNLNPYVFAFIAMVCIAPFAVASWHFVEKKALSLKTKLR